MLRRLNKYLFHVLFLLTSALFVHGDIRIERQREITQGSSFTFVRQGSGASTTYRYSLSPSIGSTSIANSNVRNIYFYPTGASSYAGRYRIDFLLSFIRQKLPISMEISGTNYNLSVSSISTNTISFLSSAIRTEHYISNNDITKAINFNLVDNQQTTFIFDSIFNNSFSSRNTNLFESLFYPLTTSGFNFQARVIYITFKNIPPKTPTHLIINGRLYTIQRVPSTIYVNRYYRTNNEVNDIGFRPTFSNLTFGINIRYSDGTYALDTRSQLYSAIVLGQQLTANPVHIFLGRKPILKRYIKAEGPITSIDNVTYTSVDNFPARNRFEAVGDVNSGIIFGGMGSTTELNDAVAYSRSGNNITYTTLTPSPSSAYVKRRSFGAVGDVSSGIIFGGYDGSRNRDDAILYSRSGNNITYTTLTPSNVAAFRGGGTGRVNFSIVGDVNSGIIFGGFTNATKNDAVAYSRSGNNITYTTLTPSGLSNFPIRFDSETVGDVNSGIIFGGMGSTTELNDAVAYSRSGNNITYTRLNPSPSSAYSARVDFGVVGDTTSGIIFGGSISAGKTNDAIFYHRSGNNITYTTLTERNAQASVYTFRNRFAIVGGLSSGIIFGGLDNANNNIDSALFYGSTAGLIKIWENTSPPVIPPNGFSINPNTIDLDTTPTGQITFTVGVTGQTGQQTFAHIYREPQGDEVGSFSAGAGLNISDNSRMIDQPQATQTYRLVARNDGGASHKDATVTVTKNPTIANCSRTGFLSRTGFANYTFTATVTGLPRPSVAYSFSGGRTGTIPNSHFTQGANPYTWTITNWTLTFPNANQQTLTLTATNSSDTTGTASTTRCSFMINN